MKKKPHARVPRLPKYLPEKEAFDPEFINMVRVALRANANKWIKIYKRLDGLELIAARYRVAMDLPHIGGRQLLAERYARMEFLFSIFHYIERRK